MNYAQLLREFGFKDDQQGFHLAQSMLTNMEGKRLPVYMGEVYMDISNQENKKPGKTVTPSRIERSIRHSIEYAFDSPEPNLTNKLWKYVPPLKQFIHRVFDEAQERSKVVA